MTNALDHLINDLLSTGQETGLSVHDLRKFQSELARHQAPGDQDDARCEGELCHQDVRQERLLAVIGSMTAQSRLADLCP